MAELELWVVPITVTVSALALAATLTWALRGTGPAGSTRATRVDRTPSNTRKAAQRVLSLACERCHEPLTISQTALEPLTGFEKALVVRSRPNLTQRELAEYRCPACETVHCFSRETHGWQWIGANLYTAHTAHTRCAECGNPLVAAPTNEAPPADARLAPTETGLRCARCNSAVCYACLTRNTRGYQPAGVLMCPRCARPAVVNVEPT